MPYIAPSVATAVVFRRIFSLRDTGLDEQVHRPVWHSRPEVADEAKGVNLVIMDLINDAFGTNLVWPDFRIPSTSSSVAPAWRLVSIIIYNWWVFIGYDTVIYLAGLGSIPHELYEAAEIDGAGRWALFRKITIPLFSPTTFFLTIIATIGTFKAFNHIFMMKEYAARATVDTASILIFQTFRADGQFGEADSDGLHSVWHHPASLRSRTASGISWCSMAEQTNTGSAWWTACAAGSHGDSCIYAPDPGRSHHGLTFPVDAQHLGHDHWRSQRRPIAAPCRSLLVPLREPDQI